MDMPEMREEEKNTGKKKREQAHIRIYQSLIVRVGLMVLITLTVAVVIGALDTYRIAIREEEKRALETAQDLAQTVAIGPEDAAQWMIDYWKAHGGEMQILNAEERNDLQKLEDYQTSHEEAKQTFFEELTTITAEDLEKMDSEDQRLLAEIYYNNVIFILSTVVKSSGYSGVSLFYMDGDSLRMIYAMRPDGSEMLKPGEEIFFSLDKYPTVSKVVSTGEPQDKAERIISPVDQKEYVLASWPVILNGEAKCIVAVSEDWSAVKRDLAEKIWEMGSRILFYIIVADILLLLLLVLHVLKPFKLLQRQIRDYSDEKDSAKVVDALRRINKRKDEIGSLSCDVSALTEEIDAYCKEIYDYAEEKAAISEKLAVAAKIQEDALPQVFPERKEFALYASMNPALDVGGDFYDFFMIDEDHLMIAIADVSGKGIPAALFMMRSMTMLEAVVKSSGAAVHPKELFGTLNDRLIEKNDMTMFVTVWLGILTLSTGELVCANAGHNYPAIYREEKKGFKLHKASHSTPLGVFPGVSFKGEDLQLHKGDILFVYTDGVTEAERADKKMFGEKGMLLALNQSTGKSPKEIIEHMQQSIRSFAGDYVQSDDITMLCLKYFG